MKTQSTSLKWVVEVYPFENPTPSAGDFFSKNLRTTVIGSPSLQQEIGNDISKISFGNSGGNAITLHSFGLNQIQIQRSISNPSSMCSFSMVGPLNESFVVGSWVIVSSAQGSGSGMATVVRFIGQIESINVNYSSSPDGTIITNSSISVREWSSLLTSKLIYDVSSVSRMLLEQGTGLGSIAAAAGITSAAKESVTKLNEMLQKAFNPFEVAHQVLALMGMIQKNDQLEIVQETGDMGFHKLALAPPAVPPAVLVRLGIDSQIAFGSSSGNTWNTGFCNVITGVKPNPKFASGWKGVFQADDLQSYKDELMSNLNSRAIKQKSLNILANLPYKFTAWDLLNQYCESNLNQVYSDMVYVYKKDSPEDIVGLPTITVRDKPYMMRQIFNEKPFQKPEAKQYIQNDCTFFDDIPRISVPSSSIISFNVNNNINNSPNYFLARFAMPSNIGSFAYAAQESIIRLNEEQNRFGGSEVEIQPQFILADEGSKQLGKAPLITVLLQIFTELNRMWYAYDYQKGSGTVSLFEDNTPISLGFNLSFRVGGVTLVGQINGISTSFSMDAEGLETTVTNVSLSHLCYRPDSRNSNDLALVPNEAWGNLFNKDITNKMNAVGEPKPAALTASLDSAVSFAKGFV